MSHPADSLPCPSTYSRLLLQRWPAATGRLLDGTGLSRPNAGSPGRRSRCRSNCRCCATLARWPAGTTGRSTSAGSSTSTATVRWALPRSARRHSAKASRPWARSRGSARRTCDFSAIERDRQLILRFDTTRYPLGDLEVPLVEILQQIGLSYTRAVLGEGNSDATLCFSVCRARPRQPLPWSLSATVASFPPASTALALPAALKALPCPLHDEKIYRSSLSRCREALAGVLAEGDVVARTTHWLAAHFEHIATNRKFTSLPRLEQLAEAWGVTPRTVIRRLAEQRRSLRRPARRPATRDGPPHAR